MSEQSDITAFRTADGLTIYGVSKARHAEIMRLLTQKYSLDTLQYCEAASYSMAMVIRHALGAYAQDGKIMTIVCDSPAGQIACAATRHLLNAGASVSLIVLGSGTATDNFNLQLNQLKTRGTDVVALHQSDLEKPATARDKIQASLADCHIAICGMFSWQSVSNCGDHIVDALNESHVPTHSVIAPPGIDPDTGARDSIALYAASTLSLGVPLQGLSAGNDYAGRHFICDISLPREILVDLVPKGQASLFSEQPVVRIFPYIAEQDQKDEQ